MSSIELIRDQKLFVASIGGSVLVKDLTPQDLHNAAERKSQGEQVNLVPFDTEFAHAFIDFMAELVLEDDPYGVMLIAGGGPTARMHIQEVLSYGDSDSMDQADYVGVGVTNTNAAKLMAMIKRREGVANINEVDVQYDGLPIKWQKKEWGDQEFFGVTIKDGSPLHRMIYPAFSKKIQMIPGIVYGRGGTFPGRTSDYVVVEAAIRTEAEVVINVSNTPGLYPVFENGDLDTSRIIEKISWKDYLKNVPEDHRPGMHLPFGPKASYLACDHDKTVVLVGNDVENMRRLVRGEEFVGTIIHP